jgi:pimeloyl-ACP methyl ester carboxylesterase
MLEAGKRVLSALKIKLSDAVFLGGWSQGGFASLGLLKKLETINQPVRAVVSASGTFDLYLSWQNWLNKTPSAYVPTIMALVVASYQEFYGLKGLLDEAVKPENKQLVQDCFKNGCSNEYVLQKMPATPEKMFNRAFLESSYIGDTRFYKLLRLNELYRWKLHTPTRYYFGEADTLQYNFPETMPVNYLQSMGAPAEAVNTGKESTHRDTFLVALADAKKWFDSLQTAKK